MSMETFICPKCKRQGCWTEEGDFDYVCKCGHSVQVEPQLTDLSKSDLIARIFKVETQNGSLCMRIAELEAARTTPEPSVAAEACKQCAGNGIYAVDVYDTIAKAWMPEWRDCDCRSPGIVPGWVMVPVEPTELMIAAGCDVKAKISFKETMADSYKAMLEAAPKGQP